MIRDALWVICGAAACSDGGMVPCCDYDDLSHS